MYFYTVFQIISKTECQRDEFSQQGDRESYSAVELAFKCKLKTEGKIKEYG